MLRDDIIWIAGFFEADGTVGVYARTSSHCKRGISYSLQAQVTQKDERVLYWLESEFGGYVGPVDKSGARRWIVACGDALAFLRVIQPYMRFAKKPQIDLAIEFQQRMVVGHRLSDEDFDYQHNVSKILKEMKRGKA